MSLVAAKMAFHRGHRLGRLHPSESPPKALLEALQSLDPCDAPFAHEGAGMALRLRTDGDPDRSSVESFLEISAKEWRPFILIGIGCGLAKLRSPAGDDPFIRNGFGFQLGLAEGVSARAGSEETPDSARGRGRALWFLTGGDGDASARSIRGSRYESDLWRGVATACTFAGDPRNHALRLPTLARVFAGELEAGATDALRLWRAIGTPPQQTLDVAAQLMRDPTGRATSAAAPDRTTRR